MNQTRQFLLPLFGVMLFLFLPQKGEGQVILLDNSVRVGDLTLFPSVQNPHQYYYLLDKARLATDESGNPQFSFLRYVSNTEGEGKQINDEGTGGGIVHALVTLDVPDGDVRRAEAGLRRLDPEGVIMGPAPYKQGRFALVSSFADEEGNLTESVVGIGSAPIFEGNKAAISIQLTKLGAKILWESFKMPTPDVSFTFEMDLEGYRAPQRAIITADFDEIYKHHSFSVGGSYKMVGVEIGAAFEDLRKSGVIQVKQYGDNANFDKLVMKAYDHLAKMMFDPANGNATPKVENFASAGTGQQANPLDRLQSFLNNRPQDKQDNKGAASGKDAKEQPAADSNAPNSTDEEAPTSSSGGEGEGTSPSNSGDGEGGFGLLSPRQDPIWLAQIGGLKSDEYRDHGEGYSVSPQKAPPLIGVLASYQFKKRKLSGTYKVDLNKYTIGTFRPAFTENIGDLSKLIEDEQYFRQINLADPFFQQREVAAFIDGGTSDDFKNFINYATVRLRKNHGGRAITNDEIRIDQHNFQATGNYYKMVYGWKDQADNDRTEWMGYEYEVDWSLFGGHTIHQAYKSTRSNAITLVPPYHRKTITVSADKYLLGDSVRLITTTIFYEVDGEEKSGVVSLRPSQPTGLEQTIDIYVPDGDEAAEFEYQVKWRLKGNKVISTPERLRTNESFLFVDELP